ncbi:MAG: NAD-dependent epimerase/dehydratase family protein [Burkholderiaceae bacterium]
MLTGSPLLSPVRSTTQAPAKPRALIPKLVSHFAKRASSIELGNLHVEREFNDVRMVCDAYLRLLDKGVAGETYNVCTGRPYSLSEVIDQLEKLTRHHES